jgi:hypothetical protein
MTELIEPVHPAEIKPGMRVPREVVDMEPGRELIPIWDVSILPSSSASIYGGTRYAFRLSNGEQRFATASDRIYAVREIRLQDEPPHEGTWITNAPFGFHDHKPGVTPDREYYVNSRALETYTADDGRVYRLLAYRGWRQFWVCRWDQGAKWFGPSRESAGLAAAQLDAIKGGEAW